MPNFNLQNNMYNLAGGAIYPSQPQMENPNQYDGQQQWDGGAQTGQKRGYDLGGFFDEVKKRKVEPTYDPGTSLSIPFFQSSLLRY